MLFTYTYVAHDLEKFHTEIESLVKDVWCNAQDPFSIDQLPTTLRDIVLELQDDQKVRNDHLFGPISNIHSLFCLLSLEEKQKIAAWCDANNNIEALCNIDPAVSAGTYEMVAAINADLANALKVFFANLFAKVVHLSAVTNRFGSIDAHYKAFVQKNREGKCPYCGYNDLKGIDHSTREAYDHFLPKSVYPFNSLNFKNLAPMCHECNSSYKLKKDPLMHIDPLRGRSNGARRKAFYSYSERKHSISVSLGFKSASFCDLTPHEIDLSFDSPNHTDQVASWSEVFGLEERYKAKCCAENDGKYWLMQALEECENYGKGPNDVVAKIQENAARKPWAECNFLKSAFILASKNAGWIG
jgi:hypothetical protein